MPFAVCRLPFADRRSRVHYPFAGDRLNLLHGIAEKITACLIVVGNVAGMKGYQHLDAWRLARKLSRAAIIAADEHYHPRARFLLDQLKRAALSIEVNIVEGFALGTPNLFRRHLRIAVGSAAETEVLIRRAIDLGYLPHLVGDHLLPTVDRTIARIHGLLRSISRRPS